MEDQPQASPTSKKSFKPKVMSVLTGVGLFLLLLVLINPVYNDLLKARHSASKNNMKQIGLALHAYHKTHQMLPPGAIMTVEGKPYHSWQTQILPFLDQAKLYQDIDFDKPWNHPVNQPVFQNCLAVYLNPVVLNNYSGQTDRSVPEGYGLSHYVGNELLLKKNQGFRYRDITDGTSNTIMAMETGEDFKPWGDPTSLANPDDVIGPGTKSSSPGGHHVLFADGTVRFVSKDLDPAVRRSLSTPDGSEMLCDFSVIGFEKLDNHPVEKTGQSRGRP